MYMKNRKQKCHAELLLLSISSLLTKQRDPEQKHLRMTQGGAVHGFTLIELLVVVLIIGILSAIALPQYKLSVVKARVATVLPVLLAIREAQEVYYMANGSYSNNASELDVELPAGCTWVESWPATDKNMFRCGNDFMVDIRSGGASVAGAVANYCPRQTTWSNCVNNREFQVGRRYVYSTQNANKQFCAVFNSSALGASICKNLSGKSAPDESNTYFF